MKFSGYSQIGLISFILLFLELLIIRLVGTEIRLFAYLSNLVLLAIFIGSGLGMVIRKKISLVISAISFLSITLILTTQYILWLPNLEVKLFSGITELLAPLSESYIWLQTQTFSKTGIILGIVLTALFFALIAFAFVPLGQFLGEKLNQAKQPLLAYSINILASLAGMWVFNGLSFLGFSPYLGLVLGVALLLPLTTDRLEKLYTFVSLTAMVVLLTPKVAALPFQKPVTFWSPYQKLTLSLIQNQEKYQADGWYLEVNNVGYMGLLDLSQKTISQKLALIPTALTNKIDFVFANQYDLPYILKPETKNVLIIGGGAGNDAAAAVRANISDIDVVEIDPQIVSLGRKYHPEKPYSISSVHVTVDDGRAFMGRTNKTYDIIVMGLADSHTLSSSLTNVQLDNYLYTLESLQKVKTLLAPDGLFFLSFEVTRPWIGQRLQKTIFEAFGWQPDVFQVRSEGVFGWGGVVFATGKEKEAMTKFLENNPSLANFIKTNRVSYNNNQNNIQPLRDNWPYIYLDYPRLPILHIIIAILVIGALVMSKSKIIPQKSLNWPLFWLGAGFMLYEVQNISKSSLIFGNTWTTNLYIISGVMIFILGANLAVFKKLIGLRPGIIILIVSLLAQLLVPLTFFNYFQGLPKLIIALGFLNLPHFFSAVIFAHLFVKSPEKSVALGSNLLGSAMGGFLEMFSFLWGIQSLLLFTLAFYILGTINAFKKTD